MMKMFVTVICLLLSTTLVCAQTPAAAPGPSLADGHDTRPGQGPLPLSLAMMNKNTDVTSGSPTSYFNENCTANVVLGPVWQQELASYRTIYIRLENLEAADEALPWSLVVEAPSYLDMIKYWNFDSVFVQPGYICGTIDLAYQTLLGSKRNVVDLGFVVQLPSVFEDAVPVYVSIEDSECLILVT